ncbi:ArsR/SmtB family transcription factor [Streptomyces sp. NPDC015032]|uniref:ArsR/SmtB family transcription factor n=1 Tax=Streptomyces sp. NPDC015032 TaxID=3364937 RepID=UPI0036FB011D
MLRLHFTAGDLPRTRVADGPDPLWECVLSLHRLREERPESNLSGWREHVLRHSKAPLPLLLPLVPARGYFPDFLTPAESAEGFEAGLDALLSTRRSRIRDQMGRLATSRPLTPWARDVSEGGAATLRRLGAALRAYEHTAIGTWWPRLRTQVDSDRTWRARTQCTHGTEGMLKTFGPVLRWRPPVLEADYPVDKEVRLRGRGLLLIPSYFCHRTPVALADSSLPPTLVYPARIPEPLSTSLTAPGHARQETLARLLGHTRAAVLESLGSSCTTSELARRAGVSLSSASEHASVLRAAGLISSSRQRNCVRHALTPMGLALLDAPPAGRPRSVTA